MAGVRGVVGKVGARPEEASVLPQLQKQNISTTETVCSRFLDG